MNKEKSMSPKHVSAVVLVTLAQEVFESWNRCHKALDGSSFTRPYVMALEYLTEGNDELSLHFMKEILFDSNLFIHDTYSRSRVNALVDGAMALVERV